MRNCEMNCNEEMSIRRRRDDFSGCSNECWSCLYNDYVEYIINRLYLNHTGQRSTITTKPESTYLISIQIDCSNVVCCHLKYKYIRLMLFSRSPSIASYYSYHTLWLHQHLIFYYRKPSPTDPALPSSI